MKKDTKTIEIDDVDCSKSYLESIRVNQIKPVKNDDLCGIKSTKRIKELLGTQNTNKGPIDSYVKRRRINEDGDDLIILDNNQKDVTDTASIFKHKQQNKNKAQI